MKKILLFIFIFFISYISYNFVEKKFRDHDFKFNNLIQILIIIICLVSFSLYSRSNFIINYRFEEKIKNYNVIFNTKKNGKNVNYQILIMKNFVKLENQNQIYI